MSSRPHRTGLPLGVVLLGALWIWIGSAAALPPPAPVKETPQVVDAHEYAALRKVQLPLRDFTLRRIDAKPGDPQGAITLSRFASGKKLVLLAYFAPWCSNWRYQAASLPALLARYQDRGLGLLAVSEYAAHEDTRAFFSAPGGPGPAPYPVVYESESRDDRERTVHHALRQAVGDTRKWGSPLLVFFKPAALNHQSAEAWVVTGELIEGEVERLLREQLGQPKVRREAAPRKVSGP